MPRRGGRGARRQPNGTEDAVGTLLQHYPVEVWSAVDIFMKQNQGYHGWELVLLTFCTMFHMKCLAPALRKLERAFYPGRLDYAVLRGEIVIIVLKVLRNIFRYDATLRNRARSTCREYIARRDPRAMTYRQKVVMEDLLQEAWDSATAVIRELQFTIGWNWWLLMLQQAMWNFAIAETTRNLLKICCPVAQVPWSYFDHLEWVSTRSPSSVGESSLEEDISEHPGTSELAQEEEEETTEPTTDGDEEAEEAATEPTTDGDEEVPEPQDSNEVAQELYGEQTSELHDVLVTFEPLPVTQLAGYRVRAPDPVHAAAPAAADGADGHPPADRAGLRVEDGNLADGAMDPMPHQEDVLEKVAGALSQVFTNEELEKDCKVNPFANSTKYLKIALDNLELEQSSSAPSASGRQCATSSSSSASASSRGERCQVAGRGVWLPRDYMVMQDGITQSGEAA